MTHMLGRYKWLLLVAVALAALLLAACGDDDDNGVDPTVPSGDGAPTFGEWGGRITPPGESVLVGLLQVFSGPNADLGEGIGDASILAWLDENGDPIAIFGHSIEALKADDLCTGDGGLTATEILLAESNVVVVKGSICSGVNVVVQQRYEDENITQVSGASTAPEVTDPAGREPFQTFVRTTVHDGVQGDRQGKFAYQFLGARTAYIVHDSDAYGSGLAGESQKSFEAQGGQVLGVESWEKQTVEFSSLVTNIISANPDVVIAEAFAVEAAAFFRQLRDGGYEGDFLGGEAFKTSEFLSLAGDDVDGVYHTAPRPVEDTPELVAFQERFLDFNGNDWEYVPFTAQSFDAGQVILRAIQAVAVDFEGSLYIDLLALNQAIRASDFEGVSGRMKFDENGDVGGGAGGVDPIVYSIVENGEYILIDFSPE